MYIYVSLPGDSLKHKLGYPWFQSGAGVCPSTVGPARATERQVGSGQKPQLVDVVLTLGWVTQQLVDVDIARTYLDPQNSNLEMSSCPKLMGSFRVELLLG